MHEILSNPVYLWLAVGAFLVVFEAVTMPGVGLFLAGLGAIFTAVIVKAGLPGSVTLAGQFAWFFGLTALVTALLWKPLQNFRARASSPHASDSSLGNMVGETAIVAGGGLSRGKTGLVQWSGTLMNAELADTSPVAMLSDGARVQILSVSGNTLTVAPK